VDYPADPDLLHCLEYGFPMSSSCAPITVLAKNWGTTPAFNDDTRRGLLAEISAGRMRVFDTPPFLPMRVIPLGSVAKKNSDIRRRTSDFSFPPGISVNAGIDLDQSPRIRFATVADAVARIRTLRLLHGPDAIIGMGKVDMEDAYRNLSLREEDHWQSIYFFEGRYYSDIMLGFGSSSAPGQFTRVTRALVHLVGKRGFDFTGYLDDFLSIEPGLDRTDLAVRSLCALFSELGLPVNIKKLRLEGAASTSITFLGVRLDTVHMELSLDPDRLAAILTELRYWTNKTVASIREISSLVGVLSFASYVIAPGRLYMSRLIAQQRTGKAGTANRYGRVVTLSPAFQADVQWWLSVMPAWNGRAMIPASVPSTAPHLRLETDASDWGYGGCCGNIYFSGAWTAEQRTWSINARELAAVVLAFVLFGPEFHRSHIAILCDNMVAVRFLTAGHGRCPLMNGFMRALHVSQVAHDFFYTATHLAGVLNISADHLSRNRVADYLALPSASPLVPVQRFVTPQVWNELRRRSE
jgi:hypothetical protein